MKDWSQRLRIDKEDQTVCLEREVSQEVVVWQARTSACLICGFDTDTQMTHPLFPMMDVVFKQANALN